MTSTATRGPHCKVERPGSNMRRLDLAARLKAAVLRPDAGLTTQAKVSQSKLLKVPSRVSRSYHRNRNNAPERAKPDAAGNFTRDSRN